MVAPIDMLSLNCLRNAQAFGITSITAAFNLAGESTIVTGSGLSLTTITSTLEGDEEFADGFTRTKKLKYFLNPTTLEPGLFIVQATCCNPKFRDIVIASGPETGDYYKIEDFATLDCACAGFSCAGYPKHEMHPLYFIISFIDNTTDPAMPVVFIRVTAQLYIGSPSIPCGFATVTNWQQDTPDIAMEDLVGTHEIEITRTISSGGVDATTVLTATITIA